MEDKPNGGEDNDETVDEDDVIREESFSDGFSEEDGEVAMDWTGSQLEAPLTEKEIEELVDELLEVESKAAEAQEALEEESLQKVEQEVREELAANLKGDELEKAVEEEMAALREEWEETLDDLETESAHLLEQLDGANVDLPSIYKWIESEAPNGCCTEAWKKRTHWAGTEAVSDAVNSIKDAEMHLQTLRPVKRHRGKTLEAGASGYLAKKVCADVIGEGLTENSGVEWDSFNKLFSDHTSKEDAAFGSKQWASIYLASTPQQAAAMGLNFPGVDEVEEIDDIDDDSSDPFVADAIANEKELDLSEEQWKKYKKVKEEDDLSLDQKLQLHLKRRRHRKKSRQNATGHSGHAESALDDNEGATCQESKVAELASCGLPVDSLEEENKLNVYPCGSKRLCDDEVLDHEAKRRRTTMLEIGDESMKVDASSENVCEMFYCTVCSKVAMEIHEHPLLKVIVCGHCKCVIEAKMRDLQGLESYCGWCGSSSDLLGCKTCKLLFCISCIKKNIGVECLPEDVSCGWKCCSCSPGMLKQLTLELEKAVDSQDSTVSSSDSDSDDEIGASISKSGKKKIRRILDDTELGEETKRKIAMEKERQERLKSLKAQFSATPMMMNASTFNGSLPEGASSEVLGDAATGFIVNVVREKGEDAVRIPPSISAKLKTHQVAGIRFMWENIIQSIRNVKAGDKGLGCILAHTMGLGKTFQVIAFLYTAMRSVDLGLKTALVVTPVNVLHNWRQEFKKWQPKEFKPLRIYMLEDKSREQQRAELLMKWRRKGGVFLIGYASFRNLFLGKNMKDRNSAKEICSALQEGPDILVCDEAHIIKNTKAEITQALKLVKSQRRIALTGSPLQNNLMEYYCMVDFVREGFLGSMHEFRNRFQNPIEYGQHANSTAKDVRIMNQRSHILYEQLKGFVQRMDMSVVKKDLPPKTVFVVAVKPSLLQRKLYKRFLDVHGLIGKAEGIRKNFFAAYQTLAQICNHPWILQLMKDRGYAKREDSPEDSSSDENIDSNFGTGEKVKAKVDKGFLHEGWWNNLLNQHYHQEIEYSGKMVLLLDILTMCTEVGDKALVFSQSIATLDLIESYLSKLRRQGKKGKSWKQGKDWFRIDGKTEGSERQRLVDAFNNPQNERVKCTLISTRAGALGINLYAANRVIIIDGSWNPTHDLQAIYRAWRYGQKKPVYAYRLVAHGTLEEKIYKRQVKKEGLAARVVDRQQVLRSMSKEEISDLFNFSDDENLDVLPETAEKNRHITDADNCRKSKDSLKLNSSDCPRNCSSDKLMEKLLNRHRLRWIMNFHEHETLLQENEEEKLTKEEQDLAWEVFKRSMNMEEGQRAPVDIEWQEVSRVVVDESTFDQKQSSQIPSSILQATSNMLNPLANVPSRYRMPVRKCTNISHMYTLRFQGTKMGCSTVCGECGQDISWGDLNK